MSCGDWRLVFISYDDPHICTAKAPPYRTAMTICCVLQRSFIRAPDSTRTWKRDPAEGLTQSQLVEMSHPKTLCRAFSAETQIQQHDGQTKEAIALAIDNFRLGKKCYHGGLIGHFLVGVAIQGQATNELRQLVVADPSLAEEILIELLPQLEMSESVDEVLQRESDREFVYKRESRCQPRLGSFF